MKITGKIYAFVAIILLSLSPAPDARPVTVPELNTGTFQNTDLDPTFNQADLSGSQAQWEYLVATGLNDLAAQWEAAADLEIDNQVAAITTSDAYTTTAEYRAYLRRELELQKGEDLATWELAADIAIQDRRSAFLDELARRKREATAADRQAFEESSTLVVTSNGNPIEVEERVNRMQAGWSSLFAEDVERGLAEFGGGIAVLEQDYAQLQRTLRRQDNEYQAGMLEIQGYENQVRTAVSNSAVQLEAMLGPGGMFEEEVCDPSNNCVMQLNQAGQDLQTLLNDLKDSIVNEAPLSTLTRQMVTFLQAQKTQAQATAASWTAQARQTENISSTIGILFGQGASSVTLPEVAAIIAYRNSEGANDIALKNILGKNLATGLSIESISNPDVCGFGSHNPYPITVSSAHTNQCYSAAGTGAFSYSATGVGGWAGVPIIVSGTFAEQNLKFQGSYVIYDANADANATTWTDYTSDLDGFLNTWNDLLPALTNWEAQSAAYEADYVAWQTSANTTLQQAAAAYEAGVTELVNERSKWVSQMEDIYREGENDWLVIRNELEKKKKLYRQELENEGLGEADLERELNRRSMEALSKMTMPSRPDARTKALETTIRAHNKFGEIKNDTLIAAERVDSSRMEEILSQFDKSINGALNTAVMETLNQAAIDSRQGMVDQMSDVLGNGLGKSVQQAFHYNEALDKARGNLEITDAMFEKGFEGLDEATKEKLNTEIERIFKDEYLDDEGFRVTRNENGNIKVTRMVPTGGTIQLPGTDGTKPEHYKPEMREESFVVVGPAAMKLVETDGIFAAWDLQKVLGDFGKATDSYHEGSGDDVNKILKDTIKTQGDILNDRIESYHANTQKRMETAQMVKSIVESMVTGGQDFKSAATNYVEGQVRGQIAGAVAEATGLPSEFISGLMGGQKPHEAVMSMAENMAWANFEQAAGIEGVSSLMRTALSGERSRRAEKKSKQLRVEDFATMGTTYAVRNQQYSGGLQTMLSMANVATGFMFTPMQNAYQSSLTEQGGAAFRSLVNGTLNGLTGNATTLATALTRGEAPNQSQLQSLTGLPAEYFERLPGKLKPASDRQDIYGRLGTRHLGRWVDRVVDEGTQFGQDLASGKYFAGAIGGEFGDTLRRRNSVDFATAEDLTNAMFNPLDYIIKPMYDAVGMSRTYDNFWAPYKKMTRSVREDMRDALAKNPAALDVTAFAAANATGCMQCYYGYAWQKGWNQGGNKGAVAEVGTVVLKGLGAMALGPAALSSNPVGMVTMDMLMASLDAGASYSYENGWDVKLGLADPSGKLSAGLTYSDQNGAGVYANVAATKSEHGASLGFTYTEGGGLSLNAGAKRDKINVGVSYSASNGFGMNGGFSEQAGTSGKAGATFGLSQRGGWNVGTNFSAAGMDGLGIDMGYYNRPGQGGGFTAGIDYNGLTLEHDLTSGQSTVGDFSKLIRSEIAAQRERKLLKERLLEIAKRTKEIYSETQWLNMSREEQEKVLKRVEEKAKANSDGTEGESYDRDGGLLGDLLNAAKDGLVGMFGGISDEWGYVDAQGNYHTRTCFVAGTLVVTEEGFRPIEEIKAGDVVLSWNEGSGELGYNKVAQTFVRSTELIYQITYADGTFIETTWNHPFYIKGRGWVQAKDLRDGDLSLTSSSIRGDSRELKITSVVAREREERVYNFEVREDHTYFVTGMGVLVHNQSWWYHNVGKFGQGVTSKERWKEVYFKWRKEHPAESFILCSAPVAGLSCSAIEIMEHIDKGEYGAIAGNVAINLGTQVLFFAGGQAFIWVKGTGGELVKRVLNKTEVDELAASAASGGKHGVDLGGKSLSPAESKKLLKQKGYTHKPSIKPGYEFRKILENSELPSGKFTKLDTPVEIDGKLVENARVLRGNNGEYYIVDRNGKKARVYHVESDGKVTRACFEAGTRIHAEDGLRNIEDIKTGDLVYSRIKPGGKPVLRKVAKTFIRKVGLTLGLTFALVSPGIEADQRSSLLKETRLVTTQEHPFWVIGKGWVEAGNLRRNDQINLRNGKSVRLTKITLRFGEVKVFNFEVEEGHSYFVGENGLWVHNADYDDEDALDELKKEGIANRSETSPYRYTDGSRNYNEGRYSGPNYDKEFNEYKGLQPFFRERFNEILNIWRMNNRFHNKSLSGGIDDHERNEKLHRVKTELNQKLDEYRRKWLTRRDVTPEVRAFKLKKIELIQNMVNKK